ncbi:MAG: hypothetical protein IKU79_00800 [Bacteroidaceae bacterium]|nr:hypothetical protein [Bacteroidaceae bacterium]
MRLTDGAVRNYYSVLSSISLHPKQNRIAMDGRRGEHRLDAVSVPIQCYSSTDAVVLE